MKLFSNIKLWIIIALVVVVAGSVMISVFGFNQTPDYKTAYEVTVSVDQNVEGSGELAKKTAENYFNEKGYKFSAYATQKSEDGTEYIYKFNKAGDISAAELKTKISDALAADEKLGGLGLVADAEYKQIAIASTYNAGMIVLACVLGVIAAFVISLFIVKFASALTVLCNAIITAVIYVMLLGITRVPALPDFIIVGAFGVILSCAMTFVITCRYKEIMKLSGKTDAAAIAAEGIKTGFARLCFIACGCALTAIAFAATGTVYPLFSGLKILLATVSAFTVSCVATPALWTVFKTVNNKK